MRSYGGNRLGLGAAEVNPFSNERGVALMIVLWVMAILMIVVTEFVYTMKVDGAGAGNFKDEAEAGYLASAGVNMGLAGISGDYDLACYENGKLVFRKKNSSGLLDIDSNGSFDLGGGRVSYTIEDESGKININSASRETVAELLRITGVEQADVDTIADSLLDWIDGNDEHHLNGAETDYYSSLVNPYKAKNGPLDTVEELLLVRGMTPEIFYGTVSVPPELASTGGGHGREYRGIYRHVTVRGNGRLNINTAGETALEAALGRGRAQEIMLRRSTEGFFDTPAYGGVVTSDVFLIRASGEVKGMKAGIVAVAERRGGSGAVISYWKEEGIIPD